MVVKLKKNIKKEKIKKPTPKNTNPMVIIPYQTYYPQ